MGSYNKDDLKVKLTPNFALGEFVKEQHIHLLTDEVYLELIITANRMQVVRDIAQRPIKVTSGWRPEPYNTEIGGVPGSTHTLGKACDFTCSKLEDVAKLLKGWQGGFNYYKGQNFIHVDTRKAFIRW